MGASLAIKGRAEPLEFRGKNLKDLPTDESKLLLYCVMTARGTLRVLFSLLAALLQLHSAVGTRKDIFPDPETLRYLDTLYENVVNLQRPLVNGDLNLLPEHTEGFANSVRCFTGE